MVVQHQPPDSLLHSEPCSLRWRFAHIVVNEKTATALVAGQPVELDRTSLLLLKLLIRQAGEIVPKSLMLSEGWPGRVVSDNALAKAVSRLRKLLEDNGELIKAVHGYGYQLQANVEMLPNDTVTTTDELKQFKVLPYAKIALLVLIIALSLQLYLQTKQTQAYKNENQAVLTLLTDDLLSLADPYRNAELKLDKDSLVQLTANAVKSDFSAAPRSASRIYLALANIYSGHGDYALAVDSLKQAKNLLTSLNDEIQIQAVSLALCQNLRLAGSVDEAIKVCQDSVHRATELNLEDMQAQVNLGKVLFEDGQYQQAIFLLLPVTKMENIAQSVKADAFWFLALSQRKLANFIEANATFQTLIALQQSSYGEHHPLLAWALADYGDFLVDIGEFDAALTVLSKAQLIFNATLGPDHPESLSPGYSLAIMHIRRGEWMQAKELLRPRLAGWRATIGSSHLWTLYTLTELALAEAESGNQQQARALLKESRNTGAQLLQGRTAKSMHFHLRWARTELALGNTKSAELELIQLKPKLKQLLPDTHPWVEEADCLQAHVDQVPEDKTFGQSDSNSCQLFHSRQATSQPVKTETVKTAMKS